MKKEYWKGSFTVEAAVVVSITIFVLGAFIICSFYLHDRVVLQSASCEAASVGSNYATENDRSKAALAVKNRISSSRLMGSRSLSGSVSAGTKSSTASWNAYYPVPGFAMKYFYSNRLGINVQWTCKVPDPATAIRKIRGIGEMITGGK